MTSAGIGAAPLNATSHASRPTIARSGPKATASTNCHWAASSSGNGSPSALSCSTWCPMARASANRCWSSSDRVATAAWMPAIGSIDDTGERLLAARAETGIRVIHYDRNLGKGYAVKLGSLEARGRWVGYVGMGAAVIVLAATVAQYGAYVTLVAIAWALCLAVAIWRAPQS